jgi:hypothetical protein
MAKPQEPSAAPEGAISKEGFRSVLKAVGEGHKDIGREDDHAAGGAKVKHGDDAGAITASPLPLLIGNSVREALFGFALPRPQTTGVAPEPAPAANSPAQEGQPRIEARSLVRALVLGAPPPLPAKVTLTAVTQDLKGAKNAEPAVPQSQAPVAFAIRLSAAPGTVPARLVASSGVRTQQRARVSEPEVVKITDGGSDESAAGQAAENLSETAAPQEPSPASRSSAEILPNLMEPAGMSRKSTQPEGGSVLPIERSSQADGQTPAVHAPEASELKKVKAAPAEAGVGADSAHSSVAEQRSPAAAPSASPTLNRMETMGPRPDERAPEASAQETREPKRVASTPEQTPAPVTREIAFRLAGPESSTVDVKLIDRAGKLHVAVRSADGELAHTLRGDLPELIGRLEQRGFSAETWTPADHSTIAAHASEGARHESPGNGSHSQEDSGGQPPGDRGEGRKQPQRPRWMDELEQNAAEAGFREET